MNESVHESIAETLPDSWAFSGSRPIELVFRTSGERTSELALEFALEHIKPDRTHLVSAAKPWRLAMRSIPETDHHCSHVVSVDANCLIREDLRPFLDANELPFVGCYGHDRFRGRTYCGVHIMRIDVVRAMCAIPEPIDNLAYLLNPEKYLRSIALRQLGFEGAFKNFQIISDYFQHPSDIFTTYSLRGLRNRTGLGKKYFGTLMSGWGEGVDFDVARHALDHVASAVPPGATPRQVECYIRDLPYLAQVEMQKLGVGPGQDDQLGIEEVDKAEANDSANFGQSPKKFKVFGVGLSRTGTHSLTGALHVLGFDTVHYPTDRATLETLVRGDVRFPLLAYYDGITDITSSPYYEDLDLAWPGSKFVLTVRDEDSWLRSCRDHWASLPNFRYGEGEERKIFTEVRRFLEAAVYASYEFNEEHFRRVYRRHIQNVTSYFAGRERDLLVLNVVAGDGYDRLAPFLGVPVPDQPFPHGGTKGEYWY